MCGYATGASPMMSKDSKEREKQYRAEDDHRALQRAAEIEGDGERMKYAADHHRKQTAALARVGKRFTRSSSGGRKVAQRA